MIQRILQPFRNRLPYFHKLVIVYGLFIAIMTAILATVYYYQYDRAFYESTNTEILSELKSVSQAYDDLKETMDQVNATINIDSNANIFISLAEFDPTITYKTSLRLKGIMMTNTYIYESALYNTMNGESVSTGADTLDLEDGIARLNVSKGSIVYLTDLVDIDTGDQAIVYAYPFYAMPYNDAPNGVFLTIRYEDMLQRLPGFDSYNQQLILDSGDVLLQSDTAFLQEAVDDLADPVTRVLASDAIRGSYKAIIDGDEYLCSYYRNTAAGIAIVRYTSYRELLAPLTHTRNLFLMISLLLLAMVLLLEFIVSRRLYRPIRDITQELGDSKYASGNSDEFQLISDVYHNALMEIDHLEQEKAIYALRRKNGLLRNIIQNPILADTYVQQLEEGGYVLPFDRRFMASILVERLLDQDILLPMVMTDMQQIVSGCMVADYMTETVQINNSELVLLIAIPEHSALTFDDLIHKLEEVRDQILSRYQLTLNIGLDGVLLSPADAHDVYQRVHELQNHRFVLGENQVIYRKRVIDLQDDVMNAPDQLMAEIIQAMIENKESQFIENLDSFIEIIGHYTCHTARLLFTRLYVDALSAMRSHEMSLNNEFLSEKSFSPSTLEEGRTYMMELLHICEMRAQRIAQLKENRHYNAIKESEQYIQEHYMDSNISTESLATRYGYSASYYARIFKTISGSYLNDYIREVRILKAKEMLQNTDMTVNEIAAATGFTTSNYFYSIFKKETGLTPAAYRNSQE